MAEIIQIHICDKTGGMTTELQQAEARAGCGLVGDRYYVSNPESSNKSAITLQAIEAIDACNQQLATSLAAAAFRRNLITQGIELNSLLGKRFYVGEVLLHAWELCQPCHYLQKMLQTDLLVGMLDRGGLRAEILKGGLIRPGMSIVVADE